MATRAELRDAVARADADRRVADAERRKADNERRTAEANWLKAIAALAELNRADAKP